MAGLVGFVRQDSWKPRELDALKQMRETLAHGSFYVNDELTVAQDVCASRCHTNIIQKAPQPYVKDGVYIWMHGECYDAGQAPGAPAGATDPEILVHLYLRDGNFNFLRDMDAYCVAAVYDSRKKLVFLVNDRYGFTYMYWTVHRGSLAWASEMKAFLALPDFTPAVDRQAVDDFLNLGQLMHDRTWFDGVQLLGPASVLTFDLASRKVDIQRYWTYDDVAMMTGKLDEEEIAREMGRLFIRGVERRIGPGERVGQCLSGGLDSRAILAATPDRARPIHVITFGKEGCDDIRIASRAAKLKRAEHHTIDISSENWLEPRFASVWWTDGSANLLHLHRTGAIREEKKHYDIMLNGLAGDAVVGGSIIRAPDFNYHRGFLARVRRFTQAGGTRLGEVMLWDRVPFFDKDFFQFVYSIPERLRMNWHIYTRMLLGTFPDYYRSIPWQRTGHTIRWPYQYMKAWGYVREAKMRATRALLKPIGLFKSDKRHYTDYSGWICVNPGKSVFENMLFDKASLTPQYVSRRHLADNWDCQMHGLDRADVLCRFMTLEIWLRQVFQNQFRPGKVEL